MSGQDSNGQDGQPRWKLPAIIVAVVLAIVALGALVNGDGASDSQTVRDADPLDQMTVVFEGDWTRSQIQTRLDRTLRLYGHRITDDQRSRASSVLVAFRREHDIPEMEVLDFMICQHTPSVDLDFPEAAAIAVTSIEMGDRCV